MWKYILVLLGHKTVQCISSFYELSWEQFNCVSLCLGVRSGLLWPTLQISLITLLCFSPNEHCISQDLCDSESCKLLAHVLILCCANYIFQTGSSGCLSSFCHNSTYFAVINFFICFFHLKNYTTIKWTVILNEKNKY